MQLTLKAEFLDGRDPVTVHTTLFVNVLYERKFNRSIHKLEEVRAQEALAYLHWEQSKLSGITVPAVFDDYCKMLKSCVPEAVNDPKVDAVVTATG